MQRKEKDELSKMKRRTVRAECSIRRDAVFEFEFSEGYVSQEGTSVTRVDRECSRRAEPRAEREQRVCAARESSDTPMQTDSDAQQTEQNTGTQIRTRTARGTGRVALLV